MPLEGVFLGVLEHQHAPRTQQSAVEHELYHLSGTFQIVGRIGKDHVEPLRRTLQIEKHIGPDGIEVIHPERGRRPTDEVVVHRIDLHRGDARRTARHEFVADGPGPGKEVEHLDILQLEKVAQYVEKILFRKIRRGTCPEVARGIDDPTAEPTAYYPHIMQFVFTKIGIRNQMTVTRPKYRLRTGLYFTGRSP